MWESAYESGKKSQKYPRGCVIYRPSHLQIRKPRGHILPRLPFSQGPPRASQLPDVSGPDVGQFQTSLGANRKQTWLPSIQNNIPAGIPLTKTTNISSMYTEHSSILRSQGQHVQQPP